MKRRVIALGIEWNPPTPPSEHSGGFPVTSSSVDAHRKTEIFTRQMPIGPKRIKRPDTSSLLTPSVSVAEKCCSSQVRVMEKSRTFNARHFRVPRYQRNLSYVRLAQFWADGCQPRHLFPDNDEARILQSHHVAVPSSLTVLRPGQVPSTWSTVPNPLST